MTPGRVALFTAAAVVAVVALSGCAWDGPVQAVASDSAAPIAGADGDQPATEPVTDEVIASTAPDDAGPPAAATSVLPTSSLPEVVRVSGSVAVVGDSLTLSANDEIRSALGAAGFDVVAVNALENRRMADGAGVEPGTTAIDAILASGAQPDLWVIALGTNDVGSSVDSDAFADDVANVLTRLPSDAAVVWVDVWIRDREDAVNAANRAIESVVGERDGAVVAAWHTEGDDPGVTAADGVHLTAAGRQRFAESITATAATLVQTND